MVCDDTTREFRADRGSEADALHKDETIQVQVPSGLDVMVYRSSYKNDWVSHVVVNAVDVETGGPGYFGSEWRYPEKPTREQIREHVMDMLDHEVRHQLGLDPHAEEREAKS